jgi:hypothetical protein
MEAMIKAIADKTGVDPAMVAKVVPSVLEFIKDKLPEPLASQLDGLIDGDSADGGSMADTLKKGLGGLLGG